MTEYDCVGLCWANVQSVAFLMSLGPGTVRAVTWLRPWRGQVPRPQGVQQVPIPVMI